MKKLSNLFFVFLILATCTFFYVLIAKINPEIGYDVEAQMLYLLNSFLNFNYWDNLIVSLAYLLLAGLFLFKIKVSYNKTKNTAIALILTLFVVAVPATVIFTLFTNGNQWKKEVSTRLKKVISDNRPRESVGNVTLEWIPVNPALPVYAADFAKDDILLGASHNVFIARVIKQAGEKALGTSPETQFKVEVISNIKGDLKGTVTVDQFGGYKDGVLYTVADDNPMPNAQNAEGYMLQEGNTYLLATRYNEQEDWYTLNSFYTASKLLSKDKEMGAADLKALVDNDDRVKALKEAYPKEKLLDADIQHGNTKNSFASLPTEEQEKLKANN